MADRQPGYAASTEISISGHQLKSDTACAVMVLTPSVYGHVI